MLSQLRVVLLAVGYIQLVRDGDAFYVPIVELSIFPEPAQGSLKPGAVLYGVLANVGSELRQPVTGLRIAPADPLTACVAQVSSGANKRSQFLTNCFTGDGCS